ncbi:hypothetical protein CONCODRAFT_67169 [Conidiobolus coronatus NRRL 28638]|uniref:Uncharacterized protein n=1 Tax=Conidiobolus coronatus (strain ATCC 28846 / CBS 209.66 / NRRL 28638) TaxID=796925 RepID=A0A137PIT8_CONC2|nr:hypothetical protein CONCODRAFT_67169 [Conidiobolus coronatus NRRL 28638]|eukprot:KXN74916.1 hypothetical protein CONCODRAFT_67169 [Conidiobolus coronatus NRRL 28638]
MGRLTSAVKELRIEVTSYNGNSGKYANLNSASPSPSIIINSPVPNNLPQHQENVRNAQSALNKNNERFQTMVNNQQNFYNMDPNDQHATQSQKVGRRAGARTVLMEFLIPITLRYVLEKPLGLIWASVISSIPIILSILYSTFIKKMFSPFALIMVLSIYIDLGFRMAFSDKRLQLLAGTVISGIVALTLFITILFDNKFIYYLTKPLATGGYHEKGLEFDAKWRIPAIKMIITNISIGMGVGFLLSAGIHAALVLTLPLNVIGIVDVAFNIGAAILISVWAKWYQNKKTKELIILDQIRNTGK